MAHYIYRGTCLGCETTYQRVMNSRYVGPDGDSFPVDCTTVECDQAEAWVFLDEVIGGKEGEAA